MHGQVLLAFTLKNTVSGGFVVFSLGTQHKKILYISDYTHTKLVTIGTGTKKDTLTFWDVC